MKILMLGVKEFPYGVSSNHEKYPGGGTAREIISLSNELAKLNNIVFLIVRKMPGQLKYEEINGSLKVFRVPWSNNRYLRLPSFNFFSFFKALSLIKEVDLIHTHGSFSAIYGYFLSVLGKKKYIASSHGLTSYQAKNNYSVTAVKLTRFWEKFGYSRADKMIFVSESEKKLLEKELKFFPKNYSILNIGIEPLLCDRDNSKYFNIVFIGRIIPIKGLEKLVKSFLQLPDNIKKNTRFYLVGDGYFLHNLKNIIISLKLDKNIILPGFTNQIEKYLKIANIFILPSEGGEGFPSSVLEAMSMGIPCMISNFDFTTNDNSIIILENNDPATIAKSITYYYKNKNLLDEIGNNAKKVFYEKFCIKKVAQNYLIEYSKTLLEV